jgi:hypothetical protein
VKSIKLYRRDGRYVGIFQISTTQLPDVILHEADVYILPPLELTARLRSSEPHADAAYMEGIAITLAPEGA